MGICAKTVESAQQTQAWADATLDGFRFMAEQQSEAAASAWVAAYDLLDEQHHDDAITAVALSNAGVGSILLQRSAAAQAAFLASEDCWRAVAATLEMREPPIAATSSSFHFRLAARDIEAFSQLRRRRYVQLCQAGREIARFNSLQADDDANGLTARSGELRTCLAQAFGASCPEVAVLSEGDDEDATAGAALYDAKAKAFHRMIETAGTPLSFWTRLECAVRLAALLIPRGARGSVSRSALRG